MQLRHFVSGSSVILLGWLVVTFVHPVAASHYPKLEKYAATTLPAPIAPATAAVVQKSMEFSVSR